MHPHGVSGIRKSSVSEGVGSEQVAELVVGVWLRNTEDGDECDADGDYADANRQSSKALATSQAGERALDREEGIGSIAAGNEFRAEQNQRYRSGQRQDFDQRKQGRS